jgi:hypothetical protein
MWDFVMDKSALGQVFSENFGFPCQSTFHLLLHNHLHYHPRLAQLARSGCSANSFTIQNLKNKIKKNTTRWKVVGSIPNEVIGFFQFT